MKWISLHITSQIFNEISLKQQLLASMCDLRGSKLFSINMTHYRIEIHYIPCKYYNKLARWVGKDRFFFPSTKGSDQDAYITCIKKEKQKQQELRIPRYTYQTLIPNISNQYIETEFFFSKKQNYDTQSTLTSKTINMFLIAFKLDTHTTKPQITFPIWKSYSKQKRNPVSLPFFQLRVMYFIARSWYKNKNFTVKIPNHASSNCFLGVFSATNSSVTKCDSIRI